MARRSDHSKEELEKLILETTFNMVEKEGFKNVSTRKIAQEIGYTVGTLYNNFTKLDDIFLHINAMILEIFMNNLQHSKSTASSKKESIVALGIAYLKFSTQNPNLWALLFEYKFQDLTIPEWYLQKISQLFHLLEDAISDYIQLPENKLKELTGIIWPSIHGVCVLNSSRKLYRLRLNEPETMVINIINSSLIGYEK